MAAFLGAVAFVPALDNEFVYDDRPIIVENPAVTGPGPWYRFWTQPYWPRFKSADKLYRPLTLWSFRANTVLGGKADPDAAAFHLVNLTLHLLSCVGVVVLAHRLTGRALAGWVAGPLFATHPVHTEAVATAYGRGDLLAGFFVVWLLVRHIRPADRDRLLANTGRPMANTGRPVAGGRGRSPWFHLASAVLLLAAVMSKEHALFVWPVILLIDVWHRRQTAAADRPGLRDWFNRTLAPSHVGFMLACATFFFLRFAVFGMHYRLGAARVRAWESPLAHADWIEHLLTPFRLLWLTLELTVRPDRLCPIWSVPALPLARHLAWDVVAGMILLALLLLLIIVSWRRRSPTGALAAGLLILLAAPIHALPLAHWLFAERWLYLPSLLMAVLVGMGLARLGRAGAAAALAAAVALLPSTWAYTPAFADNLSMAREVVRRQPDNFQGRRHLAAVLYHEGRYAAATHAANELIDRFEPISGRFGPVTDAYLVLVKSHLQLGDGRRALEALDTYERLRRTIPEPSLTAARRRAEALVEGQRLRRATTGPNS